MEEFRDAVLKFATEVSEYKLMRQVISRCNERLNDKVFSVVLQNRKVFEKRLQQRSEEAFDGCRKERRRVEAVIREAKREMRRTG